MQIKMKVRGIKRTTQNQNEIEIVEFRTETKGKHWNSLRLRVSNPKEFGKWSLGAEYIFTIKPTAMVA